MMAVVLFSCNNNTSGDEPVKTDSNNKKKDSIPPSVPETEKVYDSTIYAQYIPTVVKEYLDKELTGWSLPAPAKWESYWFNLYKKDSSLVNFLRADFNCDGQTDYALIMREKKGTIAAYAIVSTTTGFTKHRLQDLGKEMEHIGTGLELIPVSAVHHIGEGDEEPPPVQLKCPAVQIIWFEQAARTYYWEKNRFKYIQTGD